MPRRSTARVETLPAPIMGWNRKDPISEMEPSYCIEVLNMIADSATVDLRKGHEAWTTAGAGANDIESLYEYTRANGTRELLAWHTSGGGCWLWSVDTAGVATLRGGPLGTSDSAFWFTNFQNLCFTGTYNGTLQPYSYNGAGAAAAGFTGPGSANSLTGGAVYKNRLYFYEYNTLTFWYAGLLAVTGACKSFSLGGVFKRGGSLVFVGTTTRFGQQDQQYFVAITSNGEVAVYQGDYPESATWALVGVYEMPPLISPRSWCYWGPNLVFMTKQGVILLSEVMNQGGVLNFVSDKINSAFAEYIDLSGTNTWRAQVVWYPQGNWLICNLASTVGDYTTYQFVMNTTTGSWWKWATDVYSVKCIAQFNGGLYFGYEDRGIGKFAIGDYEATGRDMKLAQAFSFFGDRAGSKQFVEMRPIFSLKYEPNFSLGVAVDFENTYPTTTWGVFADSTEVLHRPRVGLQGLGRAASLRMSGRIQDNSGGNGFLKLNATDVIYNEGDIV